MDFILYGMTLSDTQGNDQQVVQSYKGLACIHCKLNSSPGSSMDSKDYELWACVIVWGFTHDFFCLGFECFMDFI